MYWMCSLVNENLLLFIKKIRIEHSSTFLEIPRNKKLIFTRQLNLFVAWRQQRSFLLYNRRQGLRGREGGFGWSNMTGLGNWVSFVTANTKNIFLRFCLTELECLLHGYKNMTDTQALLLDIICYILTILWS